MENELFCDFCGGIFPSEELEETEAGELICPDCEEKRDASTHGGPY